MNPGDGKSNPFGNGAGGAGGPKTMPTNFVTNPGGSRNPVKTQQPDDGHTINSQDAAPGGRILKADATPLPSKDIGVGSIGNGGKPFKLNGD